MKHFLFAVYCILVATICPAQQMLSLPDSAMPGQSFAKCLFYDSTVLASNIYDEIVNTDWDTMIFKSLPARDIYSVEWPIFDTVTLKIPVDKATRMVFVPDEYEIALWREMTAPPFLKVVKSKCGNFVLGANEKNCIMLSTTEVPPVFKNIPYLRLKVTAHQYHVESTDTIIFRNILEVSPKHIDTIKLLAVFDTLYLKVHAHATYTDWVQVYPKNCSSISIKDLQENLSKKGYYAGKIDNIIGKQSKIAATRFQANISPSTDLLAYEDKQLLGMIEQFFGPDWHQKKNK